MRVVAFVLIAALAAGTPITGFAQLSSPITDSISVGKGAGVHSPNSPFAPLKDRADVVSWSILTTVKTKLVKNRIVPIYSIDVLALNHKSQRIQGFMMPLESSEKQKHFLLSSVPLTCSFCLPGGPESIVEVKTKSPVKYSTAVVVVEGQFSILENDPYGLYYRMTDAFEVK